jgi:GTP-binding protein
MKIDTADFTLSAPDLASCPKSALPEFAFIGRSNVGKSSLVNMLTGRKDLAKVSDLPGKTKLINFFLINERWHLVDLPGYGFASTSRREQSQFNKAVSDYLEQRRNICCVFVLIDSRLPPQKIDLEFLNWLVSCEVPFALVFTKTDKESASHVSRMTAQFKAALGEIFDGLPEMFTSSAKTKLGRNDILGYIGQKLTESNRG